MRGFISHSEQEIVAASAPSALLAQIIRPDFRRRAVFHLYIAGLLSGLTVACGDGSSAPPSDPPKETSPDPNGADYRGYEAINETLRARLVSTPVSFELSAYLGTAGSELAQLLGSWQDTGINNGFQNGAPNALNFTVWRVAFSRLGRDVAALCPGASKPPLVENFGVHAHLAPTVKALCTWPDAGARDEAVLQSLWSALAAYDAPPSEYEAWRDHFLGETYRNKKADDVIPLMVTMAMLNPHVLLQK
jgi:hypothetical protein